MKMSRLLVGVAMLASVTFAIGSMAVAQRFERYHQTIRRSDHDPARVSANPHPTFSASDLMRSVFSSL